MLNDVILEQKKIQEQMLSLKYVPRSKDEFGKKIIDYPLIKAVLGPRRAGKSIYSRMLLRDRPCMYFNFDDEILANTEKFTTTELMKSLHEVYGKNIKTILFDEIQNLPNWELFANRLHREKYNLVLTGSNANLLSKELATHLTGRHIPIEILPFDFKEFLNAKNITINPEYISLPQEHGQLLNVLQEYLTIGGFPEVVIHNIDPRDYLNTLFDSLLFKDVVKRHRIKFSAQVANMGVHLLNNYASLYTLRKIQKILDLKSITTTEKYARYLEEAYLVFSLLCYSTTSANRIRSPKKIYAVDNGLIRAKVIQHSPDMGRLMENLVFMELIKRGHKLNREVFYYKTRNQKEVDFVLRQGHITTELIQVCYDTSHPDTRSREIKALKEANEELHAEKCTIISWDEKSQTQKDGLTIDIIPLWEWLIS